MKQSLRAKITDVQWNVERLFNRHRGLSQSGDYTQNRIAGKFKVPGLRGLLARAPYFHNGTATTLMDVVNFYDQRFNMLLTDDEKADLVAFMNAL